MTNNDFIAAARAEGLRLWPGTDFGHLPARFAFLDGAVWARDHIAAQEPTDAEVEAVATLLAESEDTGSIETARAALTAAKEARP